jgi:1,2-diacylglycerol 3-alpha-glucosyltransferase
MKIVHCCLSNFYIDNFAYQENELIAANVHDGHEVTVIASTETYDSQCKLAYVEPAEYIGSDGAKVIRVPYRPLRPSWLASKLRLHPGVSDLLSGLKPDVVLFHGTCGWELLTVARYKKRFPTLKFYVDSHEDFYNSAKTFASKWLLHYIYYRTILRKCLHCIDKILYVNMDAISFLHNFYGVPETSLEFYPLGGQVFTDEVYSETRAKARYKHGIEKHQTVFIQTGKLDKSKKLVDSLEAFLKLTNRDLRFFIAGHLHDDIATTVQSLARTDDRIRILGWQTPDELRMLLCAADVYVQPGTQSATMQMSLCCRCAVILDDVPSHRPFMSGNGWLVGNRISLDEAFRKVGESQHQLAQLAAASASIAARLLDYRSLAGRLYR